jgi:tetratricopeptide (TPR) repeat protein
MPGSRPRDESRGSDFTDRLAGREHLILGLVFLVALVMRCLHWWGQARNNPFFGSPMMDELKHHEWAQQIASGQGLGPQPFFRAPLYYHLLAALYVLAGPNIALARLIGCLIGAATCYLLARLGAALDGLRVGLLAGLIAAVYWPMIYFDAELLTVGLEIFFNTLLLLLLWHAVRRDSLPLFFVSGLVWGLSAVTRPNVLAFAPGILVWLWVGARLSRRRLRRLPAMALILVGAVLSILPVTIYNRLVGGEWVLIATNGGVNFYIGNNPQSDGISAVLPGSGPGWAATYEHTHRIPEVELGHRPTESEVSRFWYRKAVEWIRSDPAGWARLLLHKLYLFWSPHELPNNQPIYFFAHLSELSVLYWIGFPVAATLGVPGLVLIGRRWRAWSLPVMFGVIYTGTVVLFFCPARYRLPAVPILILLAALGLSRLPGLLRARRVLPLAAYAGLAGLGAWFMVANPPSAEFLRQEEGRALHNLGAHYARLAQTQPELVDRALQYLLDAVRLRPNDPGLHLSLGIWLSRFDRLEEAGPHFARSVVLQPADAEARRCYGDWLFYNRTVAEAAEQYRQAVLLDPGDAEAQSRLGIALALLEREDEALLHLRTAIELRPDLVEPRHRLGRILAARGDYAAAMEQFEQALRHEPAYAPALFDLGTTLSRLGRYDRAEECFRQVLNRRPNDTQAAQNLALLLWRKDRAAEAIAVLREALQQSPDDLGLLNDLAGMLVSVRDPALRDSRQVIELAERALKLGSRENLTLLDTLSIAYADTGQLAKAIDTAEEALRLARAAGRSELSASIEARLKLFRQVQASQPGN